jgi:undecaprenyl-diphosphatase
MLDQLISNSMHLIQSPTTTKIMQIITFLGDKYFIATISLILLVFLIYKRQYIKTKIFVIAIGLGIIISQTLKYITHRPRPENMLIIKDGFSFPSGHATLSIIFFGILIFIFQDKIKNNIIKYTFITLNIILISLISFSRIYLNVHWLTDVLAGLLLGLICIISSIIIVKKYFPKKNKIL